MKIWLDDWRPAPKGWFWVKNAADAKKLLSKPSLKFESISLDHDLGLYEETGYGLAEWMVENSIYPEELIQIHTGDPVGRDNLVQLFQRYAPKEIEIKTIWA
jgi:hypothetical protein